jgi:hypothetical protein
MCIGVFLVLKGFLKEEYIFKEEALAGRSVFF